jgi:hypothetical protein
MASTTPPERPGPTWNLPQGARLPLPGNAEAAIWIIALIVAAIVVAIADKITNVAWFDYFKWTSVAYLLSRGIAKASRVLEQ